LVGVVIPSWKPSVENTAPMNQIGTVIELCWKWLRGHTTTETDICWRLKYNPLFLNKNSANFLGTKAAYPKAKGLLADKGRSSTLTPAR
jgi:hypothetical protein